MRFLQFEACSLVGANSEREKNLYIQNVYITIDETQGSKQANKVKGIVESDNCKKLFQLIKSEISVVRHVVVPVTINI